MNKCTVLLQKFAALHLFVYFPKVGIINSKFNLIIVNMYINSEVEALTFDSIDNLNSK
jgi:hypothetical protein